MKKECSIVRDLLPLYIEEMVSADTGGFVKEHLDGCEECRGEYDRMKLPKMQNKGGEEVNDKEQSAVRGDVAPLVNLRRRLRKRKVQTILCTGLFLVALFVSAFAALSVPVYVPYAEDLLAVTENGDGGITIVFDERVTDYLCVTDAYSDAEEETSRDARSYRIEAWTSLWSKWFSKGGVRTVTIPGEAAREISVYYTSNDGHEDVCVYGEPVTSGGVITLPRYVLSYYFVLAVFCGVVLLIIWLLVKRDTRKKAVIGTVLCYPVSYCIAHMIIAGYRPRTYTAGRDFMFILFLSILIYGGILLARSIYREKKEIKELTK